MPFNLSVLNILHSQKTMIFYLSETQKLHVVGISPQKKAMKCQQNHLWSPATVIHPVLWQQMLSRVTNTQSIHTRVYLSVCFSYTQSTQLPNLKSGTQHDQKFKNSVINATHWEDWQKNSHMVYVSLLIVLLSELFLYNKKVFP